MLVGMRSTCARYGFIALACSSILIVGCERDSYTSWSCKSPEGIKTAMVLKKAQMLLLGVWAAETFPSKQQSCRQLCGCPAVNEI